MNNDSAIITENSTIRTLVILLAVIVAVAAMIAWGRAVSMTHDAKVVSTRVDKAHLEVVITDRSQAFDNYRAEVRSYPDRYFITADRDRTLARDTYEFQVDEKTFDRAERGKVIANPNPTRAAHEVVESSTWLGMSGDMSRARIEAAKLAKQYNIPVSEIIVEP